MNMWYMHDQDSVFENETHNLLWDFEIQTDHLISARRSDLIKIYKKQRTCRIVDFAVLTDDNLSQKNANRMISTSTFLENWKKFWIIPIVIGALGKVTKGLVQGREDLKITGRVETVQTTALLRSARILRRVQKIWGDLLSLKLQWKTISKRW